MKIIKVDLSERSYEIAIGKQNYANLGRFVKGLNIGRDAFIITNKKIWKILGSKVAASLKKHGFSLHCETIPDSEKAKSLAIWSKLIANLSSYDKKREIFLIALGGGVVGDIAGFIASVYKRGIPYIQVPTTLLAQVDSAIGGKTAVDLACGKNLVGSFYQPRLVFSDISALESLSPREIRNGLAEIVKYGIIKDAHLFGYLESKQCKKEGGFGFSSCDWEYLISNCSKIKSGIVEKDEHDRLGIRMILNFGHTIGHGIEAASQYSHRYHHGEAITLGMLSASDIADKLGFTKQGTTRRIETLVSRIGLPCKISSLRISNIMKAIGYDKKFKGSQSRMVIPIEIGKVVLRENIPLALIQRTIEKRMAG